MVKIIILILGLCLGQASWAWAEDLAMAATLPPAVHVITGGTIKSISWADAVKGTRSEILVNISGKNIHILVTPTTTLWDYEAKAIMPDQVVPRRRVNVIYLTTPEGLNIAKSIKLLK